ncbi:MAG: NAD-dependent epimerase/dehydratase family protein [Puniceicoccales bacterium]|jgi:nucleoside-diphosphate-sugar epimerase|nr:NAD-dependent epimerase/dehydratase family protein [Puniceicoccales bacterium]
MKVLVTGGGGFLGCYIVELLQKRGYSVRIVGRRRQPILESRGVECIKGDISFQRDAERAVQGVDAVFHVAGRTSIDMKFLDYYNAHVIGTENIVRACKSYGVSKLVHTSTPAVVFNGRGFSGCDESLPLCKHYHWYYSRTKALAEEYVLKNNSEDLKTVAIRPHLMLGEGDPHLIPTIIHNVKKGKLKIVGEGKNLVDITFVDNAAHAHLLAFDALETGKACGKAYFIGQERPVNLWEFINTILKNVGFPSVKKRVTFRHAYFFGAFAEHWYRMFRRSKMPPMTRALAVALSKDHYFSHKRAHEDLGYRPRVTIEEGLTSLIKILRLQMKILGIPNSSPR